MLKKKIIYPIVSLLFFLNITQAQNNLNFLDEASGISIVGTGLSIDYAMEFQYFPYSTLEIINKNINDNISLPQNIANKSFDTTNCYQFEYRFGSAYPTERQTISYLKDLIYKYETDSTILLGNTSYIEELEYPNLVTLSKTGKKITSVSLTPENSTTPKKVADIKYSSSLITITFYYEGKYPSCQKRIYLNDSNQVTKTEFYNKNGADKWELIRKVEFTYELGMLKTIGESIYNIIERKIEKTALVQIN